MAQLPEQQSSSVHFSPLQRAFRLLYRLWRRVENAVFGLVLLLIIVYFTLQTTLVQNWLIHKITGYLSDDLQTTVRIGHVDISFFDNVVLEDFFVADLKGDTLLYAEKLTAGLNANFFTLFSSKLEFNDLSLTRARFNLRRLEGEEHSNLQFILDYFSGTKPRPKRAPKPFRLRVQNLRLTDVEFLQDDQVRGQRMLFRIPQAAVRVNNLDFAAKIVDVQSAIFEGLAVEIASYTGKPLPGKSLLGDQPAAQPVVVPLDSLANLVPPTLLRLTVGHFELKESRLRVDKYTVSPGKQTPDGVMDFNHLALQGLDFVVDSLVGDGNMRFHGRLQRLAAREQSGFELTNATAREVVVTDTLAALYGAYIRTPGSFLGDTIAFHYPNYGYRAFRHFNDQVSLEGHFASGSRLQLGDLRYFSQGIANNTFFTKNKDKIAAISGSVIGRVNRLKARDLEIGLGDGTLVRGKFNGDDLAKGRDQMRLEFDFEEAYTNLRTVRDLIPGFSAPAYFDKLGSVGFQGNYQILFGYNHILHGKLNTAIGAGAVDMELDLTNGRERATYSGTLEMHRFNLREWTGNSNFGQTTFHIKIAEGSTGLTLPTIKAKVSGTVDSLHFKDYDYKNIRLDGAFDHYVFDGKVQVDEDNIGLDFTGSVNLKDTVPEYSFEANLKRLNLGALHLVEQDWIVSGKVDEMKMRFKNLRQFEGGLHVHNLVLLEDHQTYYRVDSLIFTSDRRPNNERSFILLSDLGSVALSGRFNPATLARNLGQMFSRYYPELAARLGAPPLDSLNTDIPNDDYQFSLQINDTRNWTQLVDEGLDTLRNISILGRVDVARGMSQLTLDVPRLRYGGITVERVNFDWQNLRDKGKYELIIPSTIFSKKRRIAPISLTGTTEGEQINFSLISQDSSSFIKGINLNGALSAPDSLWQIRFNASNLALFNEEWYISEENYVRFGRKFFATQDFELSNNKNQRILLDSFNLGRGLALSFTNFDVNVFNQFYTVKNIAYRGKIFDFDVKVDDVFKMQGMNLFLTTDTIFLNGQPYGDITGNVEMASLEAPLTWKVFLRDHDQQLRIAGAWLASAAPELRRKGRGDDEEEFTVQPGEFQTHITATSFPLNILQQFLPGISKTSGVFNADLRLGGRPSRIGMNGSATILNGQFQLDYLKSMYHIRNQTITLTDYKVWAEGDTILDGSTRNVALIHGGLRHDHFRDWTLDCSIASVGNNFMILNTSANDNQLYYGQALGRFTARFTGSFVRTNIQIDAVTGRETRLYIPLSSASDVKDVNFITFKNKQPQDSTAAPRPTNSPRGFRLTDLKGLNFEMNVTVTEDAEVQLIFDEQSGDIIKGRGDGDITLSINREGEFKMYGNYTIKRGEYLFTLLNWVNKPFTVAEGGTINWSGDPYQAELNLDATYEENTSLYNLLREELELTGAQDLAAEAGKATEVIVTMHLKGDLFRPNITFDLDFPNLSSRIKTLAENKLRLLRQDPNELNRQVFGAVVVGSFLPSGGTGFIQSADYAASAFNTLTQVLSNQLSNYLTALAAEWFGGTVSSIDFNIAYNEYRNVLADQSDPNQTPQIGRELQVRLSSGFANDRVTVQFGSQFGLGQPGTTTQDGFLGEDVTVEIQITENRQWRLKVYQRTEPDIAGGQRRARYGFGISFRKDYDDFAELMQGVGDWFRSNKKKSG